jgi:hypothetical protein
MLCLNIEKVQSLKVGKKSVIARGWAIVDKQTGEIVQNRTFEVCPDVSRLRRVDNARDEIVEVEIVVR